MTKRLKNLTQGFTSVELSIVIIIIGFLIAGIAAGQSLIKQASINAAISDMQNFQTAYNTFLQRYSAIPGDMTNPDSYWPAGVNGCAITAGNCNGNGDGIIQFSHDVNDEAYAAWREMSLAGIISAVAAAMPDNWAGVETVGLTVPSSRISGAGYILNGGGSSSFFGSGNLLIGGQWTDATNAVYIAKPSSTWGLAAAALSAGDAFNIDKKLMMVQ